MCSLEEEGVNSIWSLRSLHFECKFILCKVW